MTVTVEEMTPPVKEEKDGFRLVEDAYFRYADVMFAWTKYLEPNHARAVAPLIYTRALTTPEHPLFDAESGGLKLHIGCDEMGRPHLLFHLKQLEYLQYYIHELHLTSPVWVDYYNRRGELLELGKEEEAKGLQMPARPKEDENDWVPLPDSVIQADYFESIEPIVCDTSFFLAKVSKQIQKDGKKAESNKRLGYPPPTFSSTRFEAMRENLTPGPGLRKGPEKQGQPGRRRKEDDSINGTGWGGFPLSSNAGSTENKEFEVIKPSEPLASDTASAATIRGTEQTKQTEQNTAVEPSSPSSSQPATPLPSELAGDYGMRYDFHCQQAFLLAVSGGLAETFPGLSKSSPDENGNIEAEDDEVLPEVGRSLFISLCVTRWERDPKVILEVGWSAIWWQKRLEDEMVEGEPPFEEMRDFGHLIISDHLLSKRNGEKKPDYRDDYLFGDSLPLEQDKLRVGIQRKLKELVKKAGEGPIYIVTHTPAGQEIELKDIGLDVSSWHVDLQPDGWDVPPYMSSAGCGSVFVINTATLFGSIEQAPVDTAPTGMVQAVGRTKKSLQHTALLMFGKDSGRKPEKCGNAGNDAFYTLEIFLAIMAGPPLPELRAEYEHSQLPRSQQSSIKTPPEPQPIDDAASPTADCEALEALASSAFIPSGLQNDIAAALSIEKATKPVEGDERDEGFPSLETMREGLVFDDATEEDVKEHYDSESDDDPMGDDVKGVFYEDEDGNSIELSD
ncbi:hypothetical protein IAT40_004935 [Kwoniella sp. CBS 6097]